MSELSTVDKPELLAHGKKLEASDPGFAHFYLRTLEATDEQDLAGYSSRQLESVLRPAFTRLGERQTGKHAIQIWQPEQDLPRDVTIIDIFIDNMPFVVDSVLAAIRACGGTIRLMAHPILPVDTASGPWTVLAEANDGSHLESFLQVQVDAIQDEATLEALHLELDSTLTDVRRTVRGWRPMLERLRKMVQDYRQHPPRVPAAALAETLHFLAWLADHNFTFLGMREYRLVNEDDQARLEPIADTGLGILEDPNFYFLRHGTDYVEMTEQHVAFLRQADPLMVTKANVRARVHRRSHMDYVGVKLYDDTGALSGELRILGLFTSMSLNTPHTEVPLIRRKVSEVMRRSGNHPQSHAGKALMAALDTYPREELFQIPDDLLFEFASTIANLPDRPRVRVLPRIDRFDNFVSILLYMPRDRYDSDVRAEIAAYFADVYDGRVSAYYPHFPEGDLVRVHFIIGRNGGKTPRPNRRELETHVTALTRTFGDRILEAAEDPAAIGDYADAFPAGYQSQASHLEALHDIAIFKLLTDESKLAVRFGVSSGRDDDAYELKFYHAGTPIPLSDRVPMLENFGFRVIDEQTFQVTPRNGTERYLHVMALRPGDGQPIEVKKTGPAIEQALVAVWAGDAESDGFNQLVLSGLEWTDISILRALGRYLKQVGVTFSQRYLWTTLADHPDVARNLVKLFHTRFDPVALGDRETTARQVREAIAAALDTVASLDEDRIIRHFLNLVESALRTNFYQRGDDDTRRPALAIKFDGALVDGMPDPRPYREIFVYAPRVEGVHMRGGPIARGGLRWSDRPEDFRTEVLGLVKAQMVKNAVIVPVGAKGGFVPKRMPPAPDRETMQAEGIACYKIFIGALLDITDNLEGDTVVYPPNVIRADDDDPYLVVAADKGTASFSDIANAISVERNYWLGDAFASGGSAGYDHKQMGITARGGWEAVKRHFREMNHDIQNKPFTAVGVGDMSGDVFGNGMLLSRQTRLIAAFDHRDIFIDPDPDPESSYLERKRLFDLGRSSWQDYDTTQLSTGGGIFPRSAKSVPLSPQARDALGITEETITPNQLMSAILRAQVDLLWFGGIGTYVRAATETDADADDRANDAIRITGTEVSAKVIGEGANLGVTQRGRIEYALKGGRINTDAIDNSAGVNSSDLEVNIKIALSTLVRDGQMTTESRNTFLVEMTEEVAGLCLRNNYLQTLALSLAERRGMADFPDQAGFMQQLETEGLLNRSVEFLPDDATLHERIAAGRPLTRPELAVLLAYAKNTLFADLRESDVPDDPYLSRELFRYFPDLLKQKHPQTIENHRLRREVIATVLSNAMVNRGGPSFVYQMTASTSANAPHVAFAYAAARDAFGLADLNAAIDALDNEVDGDVQLALYAEVQALQIGQTLWFLRNVDTGEGLSAIVARYQTGIAKVREKLGTLLPKDLAESVAQQAVSFVDGGTPRDVARRVAELSALSLASDIVLVADRRKTDILETASTYFKVLDTFHLGRITEEGSRIALADRYDRMALDRSLANLMRAQRDLTADVLAAADGATATRFNAWHDERADEIDRITGMVTDLTEGDLTVSRLSVTAGLLSDLVRS